jgi:hypothetical protein
MPASVCNGCDVSYPYIVQVCRVCGCFLTPRALGTPDDKWEEKADRLIEAVEKSRCSTRLDCSIVEDEAGRMWLHSIDVRRSWTGAVDTFDVFETMDYLLVEVQGWDAGRRRWLVEQVGETMPADPASRFPRA